MKFFVVSTIALFAIGANQAAAQCSPTGALRFNQIRAALGNNWACAKDGADMWNERIPSATSGTFAECHSGQTTGPDPIDNNKGTFLITNNTGPNPPPDTITYTYPPAGGSYTYQVYEDIPGTRYTFCRVTPNDAKTYTVYITTCPPPTLNSCP